MGEVVSHIISDLVASGLYPPGTSPFFATGTTSARSPADRAADTLNVMDFLGAVGDGITDDSAAVLAWLNACAATGKRAIGAPGKVFKLSDAFHAYIRTPFDANGSEFVTSNNGQSGPVFTIESQAADIETVSLATVNAWTGLYRGSQCIPELTERGWSYSFWTADENMLNRSTGSDGVPKGEAFEVATDFGHLSKTITGSYTQPFTDVTASRRRIRERIVVEGLIVRLTTGAVLRNKVILTQRPHTTLRNCKVINGTTTPIAQGFAHLVASGLTYNHCFVDGMAPGGTGTTNYGFNGSYCDNVRFENCGEQACRRGIDSSGCSNYVIDGGNYPDGIGAHWVDGVYVYGKPFISCNSINPQPFWFSGSDIDIESARVYLPYFGYVTRVFGMRGDLPELRGICRIGEGVEITIDETADVATGITLSVMDFSPFSYNAARTVSLPSIIDCQPGMIRQLGASSDNFISLVTMPKLTAAQFPQSIQMPSRIIIHPRALELAAGYANGGNSRLTALLYKSDTSIGAICKVSIDGVRRMNISTNLASASSPGTAGRYDIDVSNISDTGATLSFQQGGVRRVVLERVEPTTTIVTTSAESAAQGDESIAQDKVSSYTPTFTAAVNVASTVGATAYYEVMCRGQQRHVHVFGSVAVTATAAANTLTELGISLPVAATLVAGGLVGSARSNAGNVGQSGIIADTSNNRAKMQWLSPTTSAVTLYYSFNYVL